MSICTCEDDWVRYLQDDCRLAVWLAHLSNGSVVYMDDRRPGEQPASAWLRLGEHVRRHQLRITELSVKFRSHHRRGFLPAGADGYFFCHGVVGLLSQDTTLSFMLFGVLTNGELLVQRWQVPELLLVDQRRRDPALAGDGLIRNPAWLAPTLPLPPSTAIT